MTRRTKEEQQKRDLTMRQLIGNGASFASAFTATMKKPSKVRCKFSPTKNKK